MLTSDFDYRLPPESIAQHPLAERAGARMFVVHRANGRFEHRCVKDIGDYLGAGDILVANNTRVIPARLFGRKPSTGGKVEILLVEEIMPGVWEALYHASGRPVPGLRLSFAGERIAGEILAVGVRGRVTLRLESREPLLQVLDAEGLPPLPPYIRREPPAIPSGSDVPDRSAAGIDPAAGDRERYQTVYAQVPGAIAAPTAGLHFTADLLEELRKRRVRWVELTLHVGLGTFKPVKAEVVEDHAMEAERFEITEPAAEAIRAAKAAGGRLVAVGSTSVRVLETVSAEAGCVMSGRGRTSIFIHPPYRFRVVDAMLTNFHLPMSTPLLMVCALAGRDLILRAYAEAVKEGYRFYSYGDCMLIL